MMKIFNKIMDHFGNLCYYPGCLTKIALPEIEENYKEILKRLDIDFISIPDDIVCCGAPVLNAGYKDEFLEHKDRLVEYFKKHGVTKVLTSCPTCYSMLKKKYNYNVRHFTQLLREKMSRFQKIAEGEKITYHDPCHLGRYEKVYGEPRAILKALGFEVVEMRDNREKALCCGAGAGLKNIKPKMSAQIAKIRTNQAVTAGTTKLVTCCPMCYAHLKENAPENLEVFELSELVLKSLR